MSEDVASPFKAYLTAFFEPDLAERTAIMRANVHPDIAFSNPGVHGRGVDRLLEHVAAFQEKFAGGRFAIIWLRQQHRQVLAEWTQFRQDGSEFVTAHSYAMIDDDGLITRFAGFWDKAAINA